MTHIDHGTGESHRVVIYTDLYHLRAGGGRYAAYSAPDMRGPWTDISDKVSPPRTLHRTLTLNPTRRTTHTHARALTHALHTRA